MFLNIEIFIIVFNNIPLRTPHKSHMLCNPSSLPNLNNDITTFSCTNTITLECVFFLQIRVHHLTKIEL